MRVVITGHRPKSLPGGYDWTHPANRAIAKWMREYLQEVLNRETNSALLAATGMALGVDQMFAVVCKDLDIPYVAFTPCADQDKMWPDSSKKLYKEILSRAQRVIEVNPGPYHPQCMQDRNEAMRGWAMGDESGDSPVLMAVLGKPSGGTANMVRCSQGCLITEIFNPNNWEV